MQVPIMRGLPRRRWSESRREAGKETSLAPKPAQQEASRSALFTVASADLRTNSRTKNAGRILIVDDEAHVRSMIAATLERQGYQVMLASGGREAVDALEQDSFELILTDIVMQDGNGLALLERIHAENPHLPVIMVTAIHDISVAIDSMRRGAYDYLLKPFEREHLIATVQRALEHRQALQESRTYQQNLEQVVRARTEMLHQT